MGYLQFLFAIFILSEPSVNMLPVLARISTYFGNLIKQIKRLA